MTDNEKFQSAINTLKSGVQYSYTGDVPVTEELFNNIKWTTGEDSVGLAIETTTCPHSEITWSLFKTEYDKL
jgi:hypothetical protein|tara:strand:- start:1287 stop:1502 length:216 start_codon:yes stop_codon:yes gene_type:complete